MSSCDAVFIGHVSQQKLNHREQTYQIINASVNFGFFIHRHPFLSKIKKATKCNILRQTSNWMFLAVRGVLFFQESRRGLITQVIMDTSFYCCLWDDDSIASDCMLHPLILLCLFWCGPRGRLPPASDTHPVCFSPRCAWKGLVTLTESGAGAQRCQLPPWALQLNPPANLQLKCW